MYTGKREKPCCLCGEPETTARIDIPPRALQLCKHSDPIAWQDIVGEVSLYLCENDWELVEELVLEVGVLPLSRCNAARASFDLREDFEALLNDVRDEPDHRPLETEMRADAAAAIDAVQRGEAVGPQRLVQARIVRWALDDLDADRTGASDRDHSGYSAETHPCTGGRKRVRSVRQPTDDDKADSLTFLNHQVYI
ncbi:Uncharacterized protein HSBGL_0595 [Halapricum desulfuricans]|uniref:DUF7960 domain-containing protein n=1 Tax=Halapricum desulfuricans TaxID=2841257 RepID=A0A897N9G5_9EURY|nr:Uncharacterized protein HSR122_2506 [Halapricum desulfuricans]QSG11030.1 Uncharacterized protein HSBGL_0595 [Halapricum desulfuricans]